MVDLFLAAVAHSDDQCVVLLLLLLPLLLWEISIFMLCRYMRQRAAAVNCIWDLGYCLTCDSDAVGEMTVCCLALVG